MYFNADNLEWQRKELMLSFCPIFSHLIAYEVNSSKTAIPKFIHWIFSILDPPMVQSVVVILRTANDRCFSTEIKMPRLLCCTVNDKWLSARMTQ